MPVASRNVVARQIIEFLLVAWKDQAKQVIIYVQSSKSVEKFSSCQEVLYGTGQCFFLPKWALEELQFAG